MSRIFLHKTLTPLLTTGRAYSRYDFNPTMVSLKLAQKTARPWQRVDGLTCVKDILEFIQRYSSTLTRRPDISWNIPDIQSKF